LSAVLGVTHSPPAFSVPSGACDCHVHVFGPYDRYPLVEDRVYMPSLASVEDLVALQRVLGLERVVIVQASPQGTNNDCLVDSLRKLNGMGRAARGVAVIEPETPEATLRTLHDAGVRALRVNLQSYGMQAVKAVEPRSPMEKDAGERLGCLVGRGGFEPPTNGLKVRCSTS
jgi:2-pyrone-4,6-dicarboxylate lactonase